MEAGASAEAQRIGLPLVDEGGCNGCGATAGVQQVAKAHANDGNVGDVNGGRETTGRGSPPAAQRTRQVGSAGGGC